MQQAIWVVHINQYSVFDEIGNKTSYCTTMFLYSCTAIESSKHRCPVFGSLMDNQLIDRRYTYWVKKTKRWPQWGSLLGFWYLWHYPSVKVSFPGCSVINHISPISCLTSPRELQWNEFWRSWLCNQLILTRLLTSAQIYVDGWICSNGVAKAVPDFNLPYKRVLIT